MTVHVRAVPTSMKALIAVLFAALFFFGLQAPAAHAAVGVPVTLKVATKAGTPLAGLNVYAYPVQNHAIVGDFIPANLVSGTYRFEEAGDSHNLNATLNYAFFFDAPSTATTAFDQFWGGTTFVEESRYWNYSTDGIDLSLTLATNSTITGKVTGLSSKVLSGITVYPWRWDGNEWYRNDNAKATTTSTGVYTMRNLEPGTYRLEFAPSNLTGYLSEFSGNTAVFGSAAPLTLGLGATVSYNAALAQGGAITGRVQLTDAGRGGNVLSYGITARAYPYNADTHLIDTSVSYASRVTGDDGKWTITGLPAGKYKVKTYDTYGDGLPSYVDMWSINQEHVATAAVYTVQLGKTTTATGISTMAYYQDKPDTSLELNIYAGSAPTFIGNDTEVRIVSNDGEDFAQHFLLDGGTTYFPFVPTGSYTLYVDPHDGVRAPYIGTQTIASGTSNIWNISLPAKSSYTYSTPATIAQTASAVGTQYVVNPGHTSFSDDKVKFSYIWLRGDAPIYGSQSENSSAYTSRGVDFGQKISVIVRADTFGYPPVFTTVVATNAATVGAAPGALTIPVVTGTLLPGAVLSTTVGTWDTTGLVFSYQWMKNSSPIAGATARTYTLTAADADSIVTVQVTASKPGHSTAMWESSPQYVAKSSAPVQTKASVIKVTGQSFSVTSGTWSPAPSSYVYQWFADGSPVGANQTTYSCETPCQPFSTVTVSVTAKRAGAVDGTKLLLVRKGSVIPSQDTAGVVDDVTDSVAPYFTVAGTEPAIVGHVLSVTPPTYTYGVTPGTLTRAYQWQRQTGTTWASISGATKATYAPTTADLSKHLRVRVITTASLLNGSTTVYLVAGTGRYKQELLQSPAGLHIVGSDDTGRSKFAVVDGAWPVTGVTQAFQWYSCLATLDCTSDFSNWKPIPKATSSTVVPAASLAGYKLAVWMTGAKSGYQTVLVRSAALELANSDSTTLTALGVAKFTTTTATVGKPLTVTGPIVDRSPVTRSFQWQACADAACSSFVNLGAASASPTRTLTDEDYSQGGFVRVLETIGYGGNSDAIQQFTEVLPIGLGTNVPTTVPKVTVSGSTYTVTGMWAGDSTLTYHWQDGITPGGIGTGPSVTPPPSTPAVNPIYVAVHVERTGYADVDLLLSARKGSNLPQDHTITGARYGDVLTAPSLPNLGGIPVTAKYQWYSGSSAISGKTASTFVPSTSYIGKAIKLRITLSSGFYNPVTFYTTPVVLGSHLAATGSPVVVGPAAGNTPGSKLSVNLTSFPVGMTYTYLWQRSADGGATWSTAATTSTYTALASDANKYVRVLVVAKRSGWLNSASIASPPVPVSYSPALALTSPFVLGGTGKVDAALTASTAWNTTGFALSYSWTRNGVTIPGATSATVTPTASWIGDEVQAHVTATKAGYQTVVVDSNEVKVAAAPAPTSSAPTITNSGGTLTSSSGVWTVAGVTVTFVWFNGSTQVGTSASYTPAGPGTYTVVLTAKRAGYEDGTAIKSIVVP